MTALLRKYYNESAKLGRLKLNEEEYAALIINEANDLFMRQILNEETKLYKLLKKQYLRSYYGR